MPKMDDHKGIKVPSETNEPGKRVEQELTDKRTKKENAKKRKRTQSSENHPDSSLRHNKEMENDIKVVQRNQRVILNNLQLILDKMEKLTNRIDSMTLSSFYQCLKKPTLPGSSVDECIHGEVLQENLKMLVRDMDLSDGFILDGMLQNGSLTDNETQEIRELTRADKSRKLVTILGRKNKNKFKKFLKLIDEKHFYPHIAKALRQSYEEKLNAQENHHKCVRCFIIKKVDIKHILDHLCENHVFDLQEMNYFIKKDSRNVDQFWREIFKKMEHPVFGENCVSVFTESLQEHYPHIAKRIGSHHHLHCSCKSTILSYPSGSVGNVSELSTTTKDTRSKPKDQLNSNQSSGSIADSTDTCTSTDIPETKPETLKWVQEHHRLSFEIVEAESFEDCKNITAVPDISMNSKTFIKANSLKEVCDQIVPKYSKQTRESQSEINTKNNQKKLDQDIKPQIHNSRTTQICIDSDSDDEWPELFIINRYR